MIVRRILLIDDDADDRSFFCEALGTVAPEIVCYTAFGARDALARINNREIEKPDLVFSDVNTPIMNGWQCLSQLKDLEEYKNIPVIMYFTSFHSEDVNKACRLGALCYLPNAMSIAN